MILDSCTSPTLSVLAGTMTARGRLAVTSAVPQAASAGIQAFAKGGNAFDAALAACFVETVALPMKCGLAGDVVALFCRAGGPPQALLSIGGGPLALAQGAGLTQLGPASVGIPGAPDGYMRLHAMAHLSMASLVEPAVQAARHGVRWTATSLSYLTEARELLTRWSPESVYLKESAPAPGDVLRLPGLADVLGEFAERGAAIFEGPLGKMLLDTLTPLGGILSADDFRQRPARLTAPRRLVLGDRRTIWATPAPTHGHWLLEAMLRRPSDGVRHGATEQLALLLELRAEARRMGRHAQDDGTSVVTAGDDQGNLVVVVHSNSFPRFGSGIVLPNGLVLNNRPGRGFDPDAPAGSAAHARAGHTPPTTLHAWALQDACGLTLGATPGGVNQLPWNIQALDALMEGATPAQAVLRPRWACDAQQRVSAEHGVDLPNAELLPAFSLRSALQMIRRTPAHDLLAVADPRVNCAALATY